MELSQNTLRGLQVAGLSTIDDKSFFRLSQLVVQSALGTTDAGSVEGNSE